MEVTVRLENRDAEFVTLAIPARVSEPVDQQAESGPWAQVDDDGYARIMVHRSCIGRIILKLSLALGCQLKVARDGREEWTK